MVKPLVAMAMTLGSVRLLSRSGEEKLLPVEAAKRLAATNTDPLKRDTEFDHEKPTPVPRFTRDGRL